MQPKNTVTHDPQIRQGFAARIAAAFRRSFSPTRPPAQTSTLTAAFIRAFRGQR